MKPKNNAGFSLMEVLVAIVLLGLLAVPMISSLVVCFRLNDRTDTMLQAQLAVSSAVETLMAEGIDEEFVQQRLHQNFDEFETQNTPYQLPYDENEEKFPDVSVHVTIIPFNFTVETENLQFYTKVYNCYTVEIVSDQDKSVSVTTQIREKGADT